MFVEEKIDKLTVLEKEKLIFQIFHIVFPVVHRSLEFPTVYTGIRVIKENTGRNNYQNTGRNTATGWQCWRYIELFFQIFIIVSSGTQIVKGSNGLYRYKGY